jgi:imidazolonepropionase-like amidohydrolase
MYGVNDQIGSLEIGKKGNVVIWEGDPLDVTGWPVNVFINGEEQSMNSRHNMLYERYKDLSRKSLPTAYQGE